MQCQRYNFNSAAFKLFKKPGRKMQAGCGCSDGAFFGCINGLVGRPVVTGRCKRRAAPDIWRKGHLPDAVKQCFKILLGIEADDIGSITALDHFRTQPFVEIKFAPRL